MQKTIILVDDNEDVRYSIKQGLSALAANYLFLEASDGRECLNVLKKNKVDLILLDIMMPVMDGWEVAAEIQRNKDWKKIPIIFLTAKTDDISKGLGGVISADYIEKPFDPIDLKKRMDKVLNK